MVQVTAFTKLSDQGDSTFNAMASSEPLNHRISSLATNNQPDWLNSADEMSNHICNHVLEQQNEMLLRIHERLIKHRVERIEELEKHLAVVSAELDNARAALRSISN